MGSQEAIGPMDGAAFYMGAEMKFFKHGEKVVVSKSHDNHAIGKIVKLSENEELVRLQSGELRIFHYSKITTPEAHAKRKAKS